MTIASQFETVDDVMPVATSPPKLARTVLVSMNPKAGSRWRRDRTHAIEAAIAHGGYTVRATADLDELASLAAQYCQEGELRAVVAIGGDGTASVVRNHVPLEIPLLPVPMGTENLLGRYAGQRTEPSAVLRTIDEGVVVGLDLGRANDRHFLLMISAGFDAEVVRALHQNRVGNIRRTAYLAPIVQVIRRYDYPEMQLYCDGSPADEPLRGRWLFGFNLPLYGMGLAIAPDASPADGLLDVCVFERGTLWSVVRYLWHVKVGGHQSLADTRMLRCRRFRIEAVDSADVAYQLDGDLGGSLPVNVEVVPGELRLLVSRESARRIGFAVEQ